MPIGKNSIKRVENGGYTKVESKAPDMENSTVSLPKEKKSTTAPAKNPTNKKPAKAPQNKPVGKKSEPPKNKPAAKPASQKKTPSSPERDGFKKYSFGCILYLTRRDKYEHCRYNN